LEKLSNFVSEIPPFFLFSFTLFYSPKRKQEEEREREVLNSSSDGSY
jgi:hypothetical protein